MATNALKYPLSHVAKRGLAAQAAVKPLESAPPPEVTCTVLPNKIMVSSLDVSGPLSRVSVYFRVGPRDEKPENMGITHVIRSMTGYATQKYTGFAIVRNLQQNGVYLTCTGDREVTGFHVVGSRNNISDALKYLNAVVSTPVYKHWQIKDNIPRLQYEIGCLTPQARTLDMLHRVAFRYGLGNSLFIKKDHIGKHTAAMIDNYFRDMFGANKTAVVGYNVHHREVLEFSKSLELANSEAKPTSSTYYGGEIRKEKNSYFAHVAIAAEGVGMKDVKETVAYSVLQHAYGTHPMVVWGGSPSPLYTNVNRVSPEAGISCLNINYSDTGLFGFFITSFGKGAGKAVGEAFKVLKSGSVSDADVKRGKAILKNKILTECEYSENIVEDMGIQSLQGGVVIPGPVLADAVDNVTTAEVSAAAKKVASGKFSFAGFGDLSEVPYLDELK